MNNDKDTGKILEAPDDREGTNYIFLRGKEGEYEGTHASGRPYEVSLPFDWRKGKEKISDLLVHPHLKAPDFVPHGWRADRDPEQVLCPSVGPLLYGLKRMRDYEKKWIHWGTPETVAFAVFVRSDGENPLNDSSVAYIWWWLELDPPEAYGKLDPEERIRQADDFKGEFVSMARRKFNKTDDASGTVQANGEVTTEKAEPRKVGREVTASNPDTPEPMPWHNLPDAKEFETFEQALETCRKHLIDWRKKYAGRFLTNNGFPIGTLDRVTKHLKKWRAKSTIRKRITLKGIAKEAEQ